MTKKTKRIIFWTATVCGIAAAVYSVYCEPRKVEPKTEEPVDIPEIKTTEPEPVEQVPAPYIIKQEEWKSPEPKYKKVVLWWNTDEEEPHFYTVYGVPFEDEDNHLGTTNIIHFIEYSDDSTVYIRNEADQTDYLLCKLLEEQLDEADTELPA